MLVFLVFCKIKKFFSAGEEACKPLRNQVNELFRTLQSVLFLRSICQIFRKLWKLKWSPASITIFEDFANIEIQFNFIILILRNILILARVRPMIYEKISHVVDFSAHSYSTLLIFMFRINTLLQ
jgi:hypothetical protein